jgi:hypothetical protein
MPDTAEATMVARMRASTDTMLQTHAFPTEKRFVVDTGDSTDTAPADDAAFVDELDDLLAGALVFAPGTPPPARQAATAPTTAASSARVNRRPTSEASSPESKVSPLFWAAAIVWSLPGGIGGWLILRKTHPRTARRVLLVGLVVFGLTVVALVAFAVVQRTIYPTHIVVPS